MEPVAVLVPFHEDGRDLKVCVSIAVCLCIV
jgi:hypothetical protein